MNWAAIGAVGVGALIMVVGIKNSAGNVCESLTGKPCPSLFGSSSNVASPGGGVGKSTVNPNTPGNARSCPPGFILENGYCVPNAVGANNPLVATAIGDAQKYGIDAQSFINQINQESGFNTNALSVTGAEGIAQIEPGTAQGWNVNPWDPIAALNAAAQHMAGYIKQYGGNDVLDLPYALAAYNAGPGSVNTSEPYSQWFAGLSSQTQNYINRVTTLT